MAKNLPAKTTETVATLLNREDVASRIQQVLGARAPQFGSSLISLVGADSRLAKATPRSILASAMIAATLDLPIEKNLGFAFVIPYGDQAQFQMGYKGFIQLAMRTGQYARMNAEPINAEAYAGCDDVGEPIIQWEKVDPTKEVVGYAFAFKLINGFSKTVYWSKERVEAHATKFSQAYKAKKKDSPWFTNFHVMALKTVIKNTLSKWGILSVQMQSALTSDQAVFGDIGASPKYVDGPTIDITEERTVTMPERKESAKGKPAKKAPEVKDEDLTQAELLLKKWDADEHLRSDLIKFLLSTGTLKEGQSFLELDDETSRGLIEQYTDLEKQVDEFVTNDLPME